MGHLTNGTALTWEEAKQHVPHTRKLGVEQFINIWKRSKDRDGDPLQWGDEIEFMVIHFDDEKKDARVALCQTEALAKLHAVVEDMKKADPEAADSLPNFHPEYALYMLESTPGQPYTGSISSLLSVEQNMRQRRELARQHLSPSQIPLSITSFPRLGAPGVFTEPPCDASDSPSSHSLFLPEQIISHDPRYRGTTESIRQRRGSKIAANVPIYHDTNTPRPFHDPTIPSDRTIYAEDDEVRRGAAMPDHIYLDAPGFGAGCCCLQVTLQATNVNEARTIYDALLPLTPIMLALTAASPIYRGYLSDLDCRWNVISECLDDRTEEERGLKPLKENKYRIPKTRYGSLDLYLSQDAVNLPSYSDVELVYDQDAYKTLRNQGIDEIMAKHIAHLFIRDPFVLKPETLDQDPSSSSDHFEACQSTNWQTLRFKPPPLNSSIGWRVEFRSMEVQLTDFENAAFSIFIILYTRAVLSFGLELYMPISKVDENMARALQREAVKEQKFWFRRQTLPKTGCEEMSINEIINGKDGDFPGVMSTVQAYVDLLDLEIGQKAALQSYLLLIKQRAEGSLQTTASWMREFVRSHPHYKFDSVINETINYDLLKAIDEIERGARHDNGLLPSHMRQTNPLA